MYSLLPAVVLISWAVGDDFRQNSIRAALKIFLFGTTGWFLGTQLTFKIGDFTGTCVDSNFSAVRYEVMGTSLITVQAVLEQSEFVDQMATLGTISTFLDILFFSPGASTSLLPNHWTLLENFSRKLTHLSSKWLLYWRLHGMDFW
jgi:hypothetical protein